ncbi:MAG: hypothetical protein RIG61_11980 [Deltaproteobacteria bacterium]
MEEGFGHLRCPMCSAELIYSEGTHDLCCRNNPYEIENRPALQAKEDEVVNTALHEKGAGYFTDRGEGRNSLSGAEEHGHESSFERGNTPENNRAGVDSASQGKSGGTPVKRHTCAFAVSFTESGRYGTLWSMRTVHEGTNYFALMRLMQNIEKRQRNGEPLAANIPNLPKKTERSAVSKLAFRYSIEVEDLYSIKYSSETVDRLAAFYGLSAGDIRHIKSVDIPEGE